MSEEKLRDIIRALVFELTAMYYAPDSSIKNLFTSDDDFEGFLREVAGELSTAFSVNIDTDNIVSTAISRYRQTLEKLVLDVREIGPIMDKIRLTLEKVLLSHGVGRGRISAIILNLLFRLRSVMS